MLLIAHRGNLNGPSHDENTIKAVKWALDAGFDAEVDVRWDGSTFFLGHDAPTQEVDLRALMDSHIWCHAKTVETFMELCRYSNIQTFFQDGDEVALTSNGFFWCHSSKPIPSKKSILTILGPSVALPDTFAVCTDYPQFSYVTSGHTPKLKLIILDIDGVMTDGRKFYSRDGSVSAKAFADKDFTAIKRFMAAGITVVFLSGDKVINAQMAMHRQIPFHSTKAVGAVYQDKRDVLPEILKTYSVTKDEVAFVGDDFYDLLLIESLEKTYCPSDAIADVKNRVSKVLPAKGGDGVIVALYDELRPNIPQAFPFDSPGVNPR